MKRVDEIVNNLNPKALSTSFQEPEALDGPKEKAIKKMFSVMALNYPFFLPKNISDVTRKINLWVIGLDRYSEETRQIALNAVMTTIDNKGGPNVTEFIKLCSSQHRPELSTKQRLLPAPEAKKEVVQTEMDKMREMLGTLTTTSSKDN